MKRMKYHTLFLGIAAVLLLATTAAAAASEQHPLTTTPSSHAPWTLPWLSDLDSFLRSVWRNGRHWGLGNATCAHPVPPFPCSGDYDDDDGLDFDVRDAAHVRPRDVGVVGVLGDSISAGFAMVSGAAPKTRVLEYRGKVYSIGGDAGEVTVPNLLRVVVPGDGERRLVGAPKHVTLPLAAGKALDRAVSGAVVQDLPKQARSLVSLLSLPPYAARRKEWKLVTVLIGANNICRFCVPGQDLNATQVADYLRDALLTLRGAERRWRVNLVGLFRVSGVFDAAMPVPYCRTVFERFHFCPCIHDAANRKRMDELVAVYNSAFASVAAEFSRDPYFRVAYQPGLTGGTDIVQQYGQEYLSKLDCFHPNRCANQAMAAALWNNMLEPAGAKSEGMDPHAVVWKCPSRENMYLQ
ncbi:hypothetical protein H9P43_005114 [Blastocladiella emersonii ATCC 22665]|nr:hypothetical protein H9P43_005114 [Blastocladiella emersonii ATCC 22665]